MKKILFGAAAVASLLGAGVASAETNAVVGVDYSNTDFGPYEFNAYGLSGAFNHDFANGWQLQMDGRTGRAEEDGCCFSEDYAALHIGKRFDSYSAAGFVGLQDFFYYSGAEFGLEGQYNFSKATIGGSIAYVDFNDAGLNATDVEVNGAYFITPNIALNASLGYVDTNVYFDNYTVAGVGGEYRFSDCPVSLTLNYRNADFDGGDADIWSIGLNFDLSTGSLQDRHTHGPSWDGAASTNRNFGMLFGGIA